MALAQPGLGHGRARFRALVPEHRGEPGLAPTAAAAARREGPQYGAAVRARKRQHEPGIVRDPLVELRARDLVNLVALLEDTQMEDGKR